MFKNQKWVSQWQGHLLSCQVTAKTLFHMKTSPSGQASGAIFCMSSTYPTFWPWISSCTPTIRGIYNSQITHQLVVFVYSYISSSAGQSYNGWQKISPSISIVKVGRTAASYPHPRSWGQGSTSLAQSLQCCTRRRGAHQATWRETLGLPSTTPWWTCSDTWRKNTKRSTWTDQNDLTCRQT